jgi:hypothetical protein
MISPTTAFSLPCVAQLPSFILAVYLLSTRPQIKVTNILSMVLGTCLTVSKNAMGAPWTATFLFPVIRIVKHRRPFIPFRDAARRAHHAGPCLRIPCLANDRQQSVHKTISDLGEEPLDLKEQPKLAVGVYSIPLSASKDN